MRPILLACLVSACNADASAPIATATVAAKNATTASVAPSPPIAKPRKPAPPTTSALPSPRSTPVAAIAAAVASPPFEIAKLRELHAFDGKLSSEILLDAAWSPPRGLAALRKKHLETDGITKKVEPISAPNGRENKPRGIPAGFREGDRWVALTNAGTEVATVTGLGFPAGDGAPVAWLIFRDEPNRDAFGLAWPGTVVPEGLTMQPAPAELEPPDAVTFARIVESLGDAADGPAKLDRAPPAREHAVVIRGNFANGHTQLIVLSSPTPAAADPDPVHWSGAWTVGDPAGLDGGRITRVFSTDRRTPLALRCVVDWNGDATQDALVFTETYEDDLSSRPSGPDWTTTTSIVWWEDSKPRQRAIAEG